MGRSGHKCSYEKCQLPDNNRRFYWQFIYICIGIIFLASNESQFSFFPISTFVAPVLIDLLGGEIEHGAARKVRFLFIAINVFVLLICLCGWYGALIDEGSFFVVVDSAMFLPGIKVSKKVFLAIITTNVLVPVMYGRVSPCKIGAKMPVAVMDKLKS